MNRRTVTWIAAVCLLSPGVLRADIPLEQAVDMVVRGKWLDEETQSVTLNGHGFYIRPVNTSAGKKKLENGETSYFRHQHNSKDDRIFYKVVVRDGGRYEAVITRIQYRGILGNKFVNVGVNVAGAAAGGAKGAAVASAILKLLKELNIQRRLDGNWEPEAAKIVDAIGARMAADAKRGS